MAHPLWRLNSQANRQERKVMMCKLSQSDPDKLLTHLQDHSHSSC